MYLAYYLLLLLPNLCIAFSRSLAILNVYVKIATVDRIHMSHVATKETVKTLGTILSVWAHPDDETLTCGGIMAQAVENGQKVICVTATRGEAGSQDHDKWPPDKIGAVRTKELEAALRIIGVKEHYWLDYTDGGCQDVSRSDGAERIAEMIEKHRPDSILTFGLEGLTGHPDHCSVSCWVGDAIKKSSIKPGLYHAVILQDQYDLYLKRIDEAISMFFNIDKPPLKRTEECDVTYCCSDKAICNKKRKAIAAMPSQQKVLFDNFDEDFIDKAFMYEAFVKQSPPA